MDKQLTIEQYAQLPYWAMSIEQVREIIYSDAFSKAKRAKSRPVKAGKLARIVYQVRKLTLQFTNRYGLAKNA